MFVSGLSVSEFALMPDVRVLGVVFGSVAYRDREAEQPESSRLMKTATRNQSGVIAAALSRLQDNAFKVRAAGVVGVQIQRQPLGENLWEYTVSGTAISENVISENAISENAMRHEGKPFLCTLSGQEYWLLLSGGYRPVGIAFGVSIYSQKLHQRVQQDVKRGINTERSDFTRGLYTARKYGFAALHQGAAQLEAEGVLAIHVGIERELHHVSGTSQSMMIHMVAAGTAVVSCPGRDTTVVPMLPLLR